MPDEHDEEYQEPRIDPPAPETDLADEEGFPANSQVDEPHQEAAPFVHTPESVYIYDGDQATHHGVLGDIQPGENRWETEEAVVVEALEAMVTEGLLHQQSSGTEAGTEDAGEAEEAEPQ